MFKTIRNYTYRTAFIVVDVQNDFLQDGALEIKNSNEIIPIINQIRAYLSSNVKAITIFTKDYKNNSNNNSVQDTLGAEFHPHLYYKSTDRIFFKGRKHDSYSGFGSANMKDENTGLLTYLRSKWVYRVVIVGLATDHCVIATAIHAIENGFRVFVILSACCGVSYDTSMLAIAKMTGRGVIVLKDLDELKMHM